jgi:hypothetical protein
MEALRTALRVVPFVLSAIALAACGGGGGGSSGPPPPTPPTISALTFMPSSAPQGAGTIAVNGTMNFTDSGGDLASLTIVVLDASGNQISSNTAAVQGASGKSSGTITGTVQVAVGTPGTFTFNVSVTDAGGSKSNVLTGTFQVIPVSSLAQVVSATGPNPRSLTTVNGTLYWSESGEDALKSAPIAGGTATVLATKMLNPDGIAFSGTDVIWLDDRIPMGGGVCPVSNYPIRYLKRTTQGGATTVLGTGPACRGGASDVIVIGTSAFWVSSTVTPDTWFLYSASLSGGAATTVRTTGTPIVALRSNGGTLYWMESFFPATKATIFSTVPGSGTINTVASGFSCDTNTFAVDNNAVYYATPIFPPTMPPTETLWAQALAGGPPTQLSAAISPPVKLLSSGGSVVWLDSTDVSAVPTGGGTITKLATVTNLPLDILSDGTNVLWTEVTNNLQQGETGVIRSVPLAGGTVTTVYQGGDAPRQLAIDPSAQLNWTEGGSVGMTEGFARIARMSNGSAQTVVAGINSDAAQLAATPASLLIADQWRIKSVPLTGGVVATIAAPLSGVIGGLTTDGTSVYWDDITSQVSKASVAGGPVTVLVAQNASGNAGPGGAIRISPDGTLFWAAESSVQPMPPMSILSVPSATTSTSVNVVAPNVAGLTDFAVDNSKVYIATSASVGPITTVPVTGGSPTTLTSTNAPVAQLALDGSTLYWLGGGIFKIPTAGGSSTQVIEFDTGTPTSFAVDSTNVYYTDAQLLDIRKTAK